MRPPYLKKGDTVAIIATAKRLEPNQISGAIGLIESWGVKVEEGKHLYSTHHSFAGNDDQRATDVQWALDAPHIKAVIFARGGYGTARMIDKLDWSHFVESPKWLCGFSDLTVLHSHVFGQFEIESLHSSMPIFFQDGQSNAGSESLRNALFGSAEPMEWGPHDLNRQGEVKAPMIGGNLAVLDSIQGTASDMDWKGKILFLEDLTEYHYHIDRLLVKWKRAGRLEGLAGLVLGQFSDMMDGDPAFGKDSYEIIREAVDAFDYPVAFNAPIGHVPHNEAVMHGRLSHLSVDENDVIIRLD